MKILAIISRTLVGLVFLFSGYVKAVDPLGSSYKFNDYFTAFGMDFLTSLSFPMAIILASIEFLVGLFLIVGIITEISSLMALIFMVIFTPLTLYLAFENPVTDCGCFGDAIILTNWETFYKNIVISAFAVILFLLRKKAQISIKKYFEYIIAVFLVFLVLSFELYNYRHLPVHDFRPYKINNFLPDLMEVPEGVQGNEYANIYKMENTKTKEKKEINSKEYIDTEIWKDTTWVITETSDESILIIKGYEPPIHDFELSNELGDDMTHEILESDIVFLLVAYDLDETNRKAMKIVNKLALYCKEQNYKFYGLTSSIDEKIKRVKASDNLDFDFLGADEIMLKTIIRSSPGLVLLRNGTVKGKWHYNDYPKIDDLEENYLN